MEERKLRLAMLWVFVTANFLYADVVALFDANGSGKLFHLNQSTLLGAAVLVEVPMALIILSLLLNYRTNRWANIIAGSVYTAVTLITQFIVPLASGTATGYYLFFGVIEILALVFIVWNAWKWRNPEGSSGAMAQANVGPNV